MAASSSAYTPMTTSATALHHYRGLNWGMADATASIAEQAPSLS